MRRAAVLTALLLAAAPVSAQERPSEDEIFGAPAPETRPPPADAPAGRPPGAPTGTEPPAARAAATPAAREPAEHLQLGGTLYLRAAVAGTEGTAAGDWPLASPNLLDAWLDARPNDRVRGFALARTRYDPTASPGAFAIAPQDGAGAQPGGASAEPEVLLDQLWLNFDVARTVFVTAGKQHVKWGVGKFWNPTDFLHPVRRDPLATFDVRTGVAMVRAHLPWEARGWNLYGVALLEDVAGMNASVSRLGRVGGGARAEIVLGTAEVGLDAVVQRGNVPRYGVDVSAGIWELDVYAEAAVRMGSDAPRWREIPGADPAELEPLRWEPVREGDPLLQTSAGGSWSWKYSDEDALTIGAEYFYNAAGYDDAHAYTALLAAQLSPEYRALKGVPGAPYFTPFYLGRHYAGAFVALPSPGSWNDTSFTLSALGNLSDGTAVVRLDHSVLVNTYLRLETYLAGHAGKEGGEFRLAFPETTFGTLTVPRVRAPIVDLGVALRIAL